VVTGKWKKNIIVEEVISFKGLQKTGIAVINSVYVRLKYDRLYML